MRRQSPFPAAAAALAVLAIATAPVTTCGQEESPRSETSNRVLTEKQIEERLQQVTRLELHDVPLADALQMIGTEHNLPVFLDRRALQDVGMDVATPVSADYRGLTLGAALELMLRDWDLTFVIGEGALLVTTEEEAEQRLETRVFSVFDLVEVHEWMLPPEARKANRQRADFEPLNSLLTTTVHPSSWDAVGGPGMIKKFPPDLLVATQTREVQEEIASLLDALRKLPPAGEQPGLDEREQLLQLISSPLPVGGVSEKYYEIRGALEQPATIEVFDVPLVDVTRHIAKLHDIPVLIDRRALQDVGIDQAMPVTAQYRGLPLRQALGLLLDEYDLTYSVADEVLLVTTEEEAENRMTLRIYPVIDLVRLHGDEEGWLPMDFDSLIEVIQTSIDRDSWDIVGGPGSLEAFAQRAALVVHQTQGTHEKLESLLADMRRHRFAARPPDIALRSTREDVVTEAYALAAGDLSEQHQQALRSLIYETVRPESWRTDDEEARFITFLPGKIVVHNRHDVQAEVQDLLLRLGVIPPGDLTGGGFGGGGFFAPAVGR